MSLSSLLIVNLRILCLVEIVVVVDFEVDNCIVEDDDEEYIVLLIVVGLKALLCLLTNTLIVQR